MVYCVSITNTDVEKINGYNMVGILERCAVYRYMVLSNKSKSFYQTFRDLFDLQTRSEFMCKIDNISDSRSWARRVQSGCRGYRGRGLWIRGPLPILRPW